MPVRVMSAAGCAIVTIVMAALLRWNPPFAAHFVREDGPVEWAQAVFLVASMVMALACGLALARVQRPVAADVVMAAMMAGLAIGELDLDKRLFGVKLVSTRFFVNPSIPLGYRVLGFLLVVGPPVALALYAWWWRAELWSTALRALREPWGQVLLAGSIVLVLTEIFERQLGHVPGFPRNFLEEVLEVCAAICFFLGLVARRHAIMRGLKSLIIAVVVLGCAFLAGCRGEGPASASQDKGKPPAAAPRPVRVAPAAQEMVARAVAVNGTLAADDLVVLGTKVAGRLVTVAVDLGTHVRRGQVIAQLDKSDFALRIEQAEAALQQARARLGLGPGDSDSRLDLEQTSVVRQARAVLDEARLTRDRSLKLMEQDLIARAQVDTAVANLQVAEGRYQDAIEEVRNRQAILAQRRSELELARQQLADAALVSPIDGAVSIRHASVGEYLAAGAPVATLVRIDPLRLRVAVPEREAAGVRQGQTVSLTVEGDATVYRGRVVRLSPIVQEQNRTLTVEAEIPNPGGVLRPGAFAKAEIVVSASQPVIMVDASSIVTFAGLEKVIVVQGGKAVERRVQTGRRDGQRVEITDGLKPGEPIVLRPGNLTGGQPVTVTP
jgi:RND family efflux transporter MFP subunit